MNRREFVIASAAAVCVLASIVRAADGRHDRAVLGHRRAAGQGARAKVEKSSAEWRKQLSPLAFQVARQGGTEHSLHRRVLECPRARAIPLRLLRERALQLRRQIRFRYRLAELHGAYSGGERRAREAEPWLHRERGEMRALRRAPGRPLRRRPEADGSSLLHRFRLAAIRQVLKRGATQSDAASASLLV